MPRRRPRRKRHPLDLRSYFTPAVVEIVTRVVGGAILLVFAALGVMVQQSASRANAKAETATERLGYANANTNAALAIVGVLSMRVDSLTQRVVKLEAAQRVAVAKTPDRLIGPEVPPGWSYQPPKRKGFLSRLFGG